MTLPASIELLSAQIDAGDSFSYLLFWGHRDPPGGGVSRSCFSQWYPARFEVDGVAYPSAEHFMMAEKARLFADEASRLKILQAATPNDAKSLGRRVAGYDESAWLAARFDIVVRGNLAKFQADPRLRAYLLGTTPQILVEASPVDPVWGIGLAADDPRCADPRRWEGLNLLGFALMIVRERLAGSSGES
jgi:ribA/ribD-fused uncharacterized protein